MKTVLNVTKGSKVNHFQFGNGVVTEITDKWVQIDFADRARFKAAISPSNKITVAGKPFCEKIYEGEKGNYEVYVQFVGTVNHPLSVNPSLERILKFADVTEAEAAEIAEERVTKYKNYEGMFYIRAIRPCEYVDVF